MLSITPSTSTDGNMQQSKMHRGRLRNGGWGEYWMCEKESNGRDEKNCITGWCIIDTFRTTWRSLGWRLGYAVHMGETTNGHKVIARKSQIKRPFRSYWHGWEETFKINRSLNQTEHSVSLGQTHTAGCCEEGNERRTICWDADRPFSFY